MLFRFSGDIFIVYKKTVLLIAILLLSRLSVPAGTNVPFSKSNGQIVFSVVIEHSTKNFLFDTGAPCCLFLDNVSDTIHYKILRKTFVIDGFGNRKQTWLTKVKEIRIGDKVVKDEYIILLEANPVLKKQKIEGIIGHNIINKFDWKFNFITNEAELKSSIKPEDLSEYKVISTFLIDNSPHTVISAGDQPLAKDTCLIDFGDNKYISIRRLYKFKDKQLYSDIHSTSTASAVQKQDTSFIQLGTVKLNDSFCLGGFPLYTERNTAQNAIGCGFFMMFDEIIIQSSHARILVKNKDSLHIRLRKYTCFFEDDRLTSFVLKKDEAPQLRIGDNATEKNIPLAQTVDFEISTCR